MVGAQYLFWNGRRKEGSLIQEKRKREGAFFKLFQRQEVTMWKVKVKKALITTTHGLSWTHYYWILKRNFSMGYLLKEEYFTSFVLPVALWTHRKLSKCLRSERQDSSRYIPGRDAGPWPRGLKACCRVTGGGQFIPSVHSFFENVNRVIGFTPTLWIFLEGLQRPSNTMERNEKGLSVTINQTLRAQHVGNNLQWFHPVRAAQAPPE